MVQLRESIEWNEQNGVKVYLPQAAINASDAKEFVSNERFETALGLKSSERALFDDILSKSDFIRTFQEVASLLDVHDGQTILELGASHGWASVMAKLDAPGAYVIVSDLVPECVRYSFQYERVLASSVDEKWAFSVRDIPFNDAQFDRIFTFAAFHHFGDKGDYTHSLQEIARILKPGGKIVLLYEPSSPPYLYEMARRRVNRKREHEGVDEDVLLVSRLREIATPLGLSLHATPFPIFHHRGSVGSTVYYYLLNKLSLGKMMVCTNNIVMQKVS
jgi:SAM-dependent methyltransferase